MYRELNWTAVSFAQVVRRILHPGRVVGVVGIAVLVILILPMPGSLAVPASGGPHESLVATHSESSQLSAAAQSLEGGAGPAAGHFLTCAERVPGSFGCDTISTSSAAAVNTPIWGQLDPGLDSQTPFYRGAYSLVWDASDHYVLLFGGTSAYRGTHLLGDTWTFSNGVWTQLYPTAAPSARTGSMITYDNDTQSVVLFGGFVQSGSVLSGTNDTWTYHGGVWTNVTDGRAPSPRGGGGLAYDETDGYLLLFGGYTLPSNVGLNDSWNYSHGSWTRLSPVKSPTARLEFGMVYDAASRQVVLFGGQNSSTGKTYSDSWTFSAGAWTQALIVGGPPGRAAAGMTYSYSLGKIVLFGGFNSTPYHTLGDTWTFTLGAWTLVASVTNPGGRTLSSLIDDEAAGGVLLYSGLSEANQVLRDTWSFNGMSWSQWATPNYPDALSNFAATYDTRDGYVLVFGGLNYTGSRVASTWTYSNGTWTELSPATAPSARTGAGIAFDSVMNEVILFGGNSTAGGYQDNAWSFEGGNWTNITSTAGMPPMSRAGASEAYDVATSSVILFGGFGYNSTSKVDQYFSDTWKFFNGTWTKLTPTAAPTAREGASMTYDTALGKVVLFGGIVNGNGLGQDTWTFNGTEWSQVTQSGGNGPSGRALAQFAYDPHTHSVILFGGYGTSQLVPLNDTWSFSNGIWTYLPELVSPPARASGALILDSVSSQMILWGGDSDPTSPAFSVYADTWILDSVSASIGALPSSGIAPLLVAFSGTAHHGRPGYTYGWNFGDGSTSNLSDPVHLFNLAGNYTVTLTVADVLGAAGSSTLVVGVSPTPTVPPLSIAVTASPTSGETPVLVSFSTAVSGGAGTYNFTWIFGDGNQSAFASPTHNYTKVGTFHPSVWVNDSSGQSVTTTLTVIVSAHTIVPPPPPVKTNASGTSNGFSWTWLLVGLLVGLVIGLAVAYLASRRGGGRRPAVHPYGALTVPPPAGGLGTGPPPPWREGPP